MSLAVPLINSTRRIVICSRIWVTNSRNELANVEQGVISQGNRDFEFWNGGHQIKAKEELLAASREATSMISTGAITMKT